MRRGIRHLAALDDTSAVGERRYGRLVLQVVSITRAWQMWRPVGTFSISGTPVVKAE